MTNCSWKPSVLLVLATCAAGCQLAPQKDSAKFSPARMMKDTGSRLSNALRVDSKVVKAVDATSLDYDPGPLKPSLYLSAASVMEQTGQLDEAAEHYNRVLKVEPENRTALIGLARIYHRQGDLKEAIAAYRRASQTIGEDPVILNDLGLCLARAGQQEEAIASLRSALTLKPDSLLYRNNLAAVLVQSQRADEAVEVLAQSHGLAVAHYNVGYLLNQEGEPAAATAHFVQSLRADPSFAPAKSMLERVVPQIGRRPEKRIVDRPRLSSVDVAAPSIALTAAMDPPHDAQMPSPSDVSPAVFFQDHAQTQDDQELDVYAADAQIEPARFVEPVQPVASGPVTNESETAAIELPPIRLPSPRTARRSAPGPGGFVAPAPAGW